MSRKVLRSIGKLASDLRTTKPENLLDFALDKLFRVVGPKVTRNLRVLRFDATCDRPRWPEGFELRQFASPREIPPSLAAQISALGLADLFQGNFANGAELWLVLKGGELAACLWTVQRARLSNWHMPIGPEDVVLYSVVTQPEFRGQGLSGAASAEIWRRIGHAGEAFYVDCKVWNRSAQRAFMKAGFRHVAIVPPQD